MQMSSKGVEALGTAFFVSSRGILLTARHIVDGELSEGVPAGDVTGSPNHGFFVLVPSGVTAQGQRHRTSLRVTQVALEPRTSDVAVILVNMTEFRSSVLPYLKPWPLAHFRPTPGEEAVAVGYQEWRSGPLVTSGAAVPTLNDARNSGLPKDL